MPKKFKELNIGDKFYYKDSIVMKRGENQIVVIEGPKAGWYDGISPNQTVETMVHLDTMLAAHLGQLV